MRNFDYKKVALGILTLCLTLAILFTGQFFWNKYTLNKPINETLNSIEGIQIVEISSESDNKNISKPKIFLTLNNVENIQILYKEVINTLSVYNSSEKYEIIIKDTRNESLEDFYYQVHYYIQEAITIGNFPNMIEKIREKAKDEFQVKVYVDTDYIYLDIRDIKTNLTSQMYIVIPRISYKREVK
ncbi:hypothetical protein LJC10_04040 [Selenomonadales bacterium OttesenSCG-928-I06]|nr:hypothetical protein [Selenomonadales bacterium OttesenSCG-928-I06]